MPDIPATINYDVEDNATSNLKSIRKEWDRNRKSVDGVSKSTKKAGSASSRWESSLQSLNTTGKNTGSVLGRIGTKAGAVGVALGGAALGAQQVFAAMNEADQVATKYESSLNRVKLAIENTGLSQQEAAQRSREMNEQIRDLSSEAGMRLPRVADAAEQLTFRLGDAGEASQNLRRLVGLMARTGEDAEQVGKDLAEALDGDINAMKELGVLTDSQVQRFNEMSDRGDRTAKVLDILDQKLKGVIEQNKETQTSSDRVSKAWERMKAVAGGLSVVEAPLNGIANTMEGIAGEVEAVADVWDNKTPGIKARIREVEDATGRAADRTRDLRRETEKLGEESEAFDRRQRAIDVVNQRYDTRIELLRQQSKEQAKTAWGEALLEKRIEKINAQRQKELDIIDKRLPKDFEAAAVGERELEIQELRVRAMETDDKMTAAKLEKQARILEIQSRIQELQEKKNEGVNVENEMRRANLDMRKAEARYQDKITASSESTKEKKKREYVSAEEIARRKADIRYEAESNHEARLEDLRDRRREREFEEEQEARERRVAAEIEAIQKEQRAWKEAFNERKQKTLQNQKDQSEALRGGFQGAGSALGGASSMVGSFDAELSRIDAVTDAEKERLRVMKAQNRALQENLGHMSTMTSEGGNIANAINVAFNEQWDFKEAASETVSAFDSLASAGGAVAGIATDSAKEQAKVQGGVHAAAAIGSAAFGLMYPDPKYWASAAKHGVAAASYFAVAGKAQGKKSAGSAGVGGSAGSGSFDAGSSPDLGTVKDTYKQAQLEALREFQNEGQTTTYVIDQSGSTFLERDPTSSRKVEKTLEQNDRLRLRT